MTAGLTAQCSAPDVQHDHFDHELPSHPLTAALMVPALASEVLITEPTDQPIRSYGKTWRQRHVMISDPRRQGPSRKLRAFVLA